MMNTRSGTGRMALAEHDIQLSGKRELCWILLPLLDSLNVTILNKDGVVLNRPNVVDRPYADMDQLAVAVGVKVPP
jgi:hypothetical protein